MNRNEFVAYYQPKYDVNSQKVVGAEALVRWVRPDGQIKPDSFIGFFEKSGLIIRLDLHMFEKVCEMMAYLRSRNLILVPISVNFSREHLYDEEFPDMLRSIAERYGIPTSMLEIEFTEAVFLEDQKAVKAGIKRLHQRGFHVAIDDFKKGFSLFTLLKDISFDIIKIDHMYLSSTGEKEKIRTLIRKVIELAGKLKLQTVAEGVETEEQLEFLREIGCNIIQGFYFSKPLPEKDFEALLEPVAVQ